MISAGIEGDLLQSPVCFALGSLMDSLVQADLPLQFMSRVRRYALISQCVLLFQAWKAREKEKGKGKGKGKGKDWAGIETGMTRVMTRVGRGGERMSG